MAECTTTKFPSAQLERLPKSDLFHKNSHRVVNIAVNLPTAVTNLAFLLSYFRKSEKGSKLKS